MKLKDLKTKESGRHWMAKKLLFEWMVDEKAVFIDKQLKRVVDFREDGVRWEFASIEALVEKNDIVPYMNNCHTCGGWVDDDERIFDRCDLNKSMYTYIPDSDYPNYIEQQSYYVHPCHFCNFKDNLDIKFIYDIGFFHEGTYSHAIEIEYTSPVKPEKIKHCKRNGTTLIVIDWKEIICRMNMNSSNVFQARIYEPS